MDRNPAIRTSRPIVFPCELTVNGNRGWEITDWRSHPTGAPSPTPSASATTLRRSSLDSFQSKANGVDQAIFEIFFALRVLAPSGANAQE